jgi:glucoamylase
MLRLIAISTLSLLSCPALLGQATNRIAPGAPGLDAHWPSAAKNGFGTSNTVASKVWFTLNNGVMTEVYYPRLDVPNVQTLQFIFVDADGHQVETEAEDTTHRIEVLNPAALTFRQTNTAKSGAYTVTKTYVTDPDRSSILIDVNFRWNKPGLCRCAFYIYYDPSLNNSGMHDSAWRNGEWLIASDADKTSALTVTDAMLLDETNGYFGASDGFTQLRSSGRSIPYGRAANGNVVQTARVNFQLPLGAVRPAARVTVVLGFGRNSVEAISNGQASVRKGFESARVEYEAGWHAYLQPLRRVEPKYQRQFNMAAMVLKGLEDKTYRGAMIASPSIPWGGGPNANEPTISGYHAVWARDLYHVATAFAAMGDRASANRALDYLFNVQQKPDGSFPQNSWVDGRPIGGGLQMDQVALPIVLAYQLERTDRTTWLKHIKPAADFIVRKGPFTGQDRWEEKPGYSPATIAAEIAGLVCAARLAAINNDPTSANAYLKTADAWAQSVERWTATSGHGERRHYLRITENDDPDDGAKIEINSSSRVVDERAILDAGFLELIRLGIKPADDPLVVQSLALIDQLIKVETPGSSAWYRYNHDAYGETPDGGNYDGRSGVGRLWTLLTGERGEYDVARGDLAAARQQLDAMMAFANDGMMLPEQVWDRSESPRPEFRFGEGTGSATPLAWSMAQFIRLAINIKQGHNVETPNAAAARYLKGTGKN